jgi:hypothetical protein
MYYVCLVVLPVAPPSGRAPLTIKKLYAGNIAPLAALSEAKCLVCLFEGNGYYAVSPAAFVS